MSSNFAWILLTCSTRAISFAMEVGWVSTHPSMVSADLFSQESPMTSRPANPGTRLNQFTVRDETGHGALAASAVCATWMGCLLIGILGVVLPYAHAHLETKPPPPVVEAVRLASPRDLAPDTALPQPGPKVDAAPAPADVPAPPPPPDAAAPPEAPPLAAVAEPSPALFAIPVEGPTKTVDARSAVPVATRPQTVAPPAVQRLRFGVGEGQQPDPEYPRDAILAREQGTVVVRFTVGARWQGAIGGGKPAMPLAAAEPGRFAGRPRQVAFHPRKDTPLRYPHSVRNHRALSCGGPHQPDTFQRRRRLFPQGRPDHVADPPGPAGRTDSYPGAVALVDKLLSAH